MGAIEAGVPGLKVLSLVCLGDDQGNDCYWSVFPRLLHGACPRLERLTIAGGKELGDDDVVGLARALEGGAPCNHTLRRLSLSSSGIGPRGVKDLAIAFTRGACPNLQLLNLAEAAMMDEGVAELATAMEAGALPSLIVLDLSDVEMGAAGRTALFNALGNSKVCPDLRLVLLYHKDTISLDDKQAYVGQLAARRGRKKKMLVGWEWGKPFI